MHPLTVIFTLASIQNSIGIFREDLPPNWRSWCEHTCSEFTSYTKEKGCDYCFHDPSKSSTTSTTPIPTTHSPNSSSQSTAMALTWTVDWTKLLGDPSGWNSSLKTRIVHGVVTAIAMSLLKAPLTAIVVGALFIIGIDATPLMLAATVGAWYGYQRKKYWITVVCAYYVYAIYKGYDPTKIIG